MKIQANITLLKRFHWARRAAAAGVMVLGALALLGRWWQADALMLRTAGAVRVVPNTAYSLLVAGAALWVWRRGGAPWRLLLVRGAGVLLALNGASVLALRAKTAYPHWLDGVLMPVWLFGVAPARMAGLTAFCFVLTGAALWTLDAARGGARLGQGLALVVGVIAYVVLLGYLFDTTALTRLATGGGMALLTALGFALLCVGLLCARVNEGLMRLMLSAGPGGAMLRWLLPALVLSRLALHVLTEAGARLGWYSHEWDDLLFAALSMGLTIGLVVWAARWLDRLQRERQTAQTERDQWAAIVETSSEAIYSYDLAGRLSSWNQSAERLYGWTATEIIGQSISQLTPPERANEPADKIIPAIKRGETLVNLETMRQRRDGSRFDALLTASPLTDATGQTIGLSVIARDITERKEAEDRLRTSEERCQLALASANTGIHVWDIVADRLYWDERLRELWGIGPDAPVNYEVFAQGLHPDDRAATQAAMEHALDPQGNGQYAAEYRVINQHDGVTRWIAATGQVFFAHGKPLRLVGTARDITDRKQAEDARQQFVSLIEETRDFVGMANLSGEVIYTNQAGAELVGCDSAAEVLKLKIPDCHPPATQKLLEETAIPQVLKQGFWAGETQFRNLKTGALTDVYQKIFQIRNPQTGALICLATTAIDITERKQREQNLAFLSEVSKDFVPLSSAAGIVERAGERIAAYLHLTNCSFVEINEAIDTAHVIYDHHAADTLDLTGVYPMKDFHSDEERAAMLGGQAIVINDTSALREPAAAARFDALGIRALVTAPYVSDGRWRFALCAMCAASRVWHQDEVELLNELAERIYIRLERARAEAALRRSEARLQLGIEVADFALAEIDYTTNTNHLTAQAARLYGLGETALAVPREQVHATFHEADHARLSALIEECLRPQGTGWFACEHRVVWADGTLRWLNVRKQVFFDGAGHRPLRATLAAQDITARKQSEFEREQLLVREQHARQLAEDANRAKDEWLAMVSHELRTPLNPILGHARLLNMRRVQLAPELLNFTDLVLRNGERQNELINDLLDTARISTGKLRLEPGPVNLATIITEALETVRAAAQAKNIQVQVAEYGRLSEERQQDETQHDELALGGNSAFILGDAARLQQLVWNLLSNAVKFTPKDGSVAVSLQRTEEHLVVTVRDTGAGIAPEFLPHVFERFSQQDSSKARRYGGLGLGLALVKEIVELHGGTITADSAGSGQGATFTVRLPVSTSETTGISSFETARQAEIIHSIHPLNPGGSLNLSGSALHGISILLVEDEADARDLVLAVLRAQGATVRTAVTAAAAWSLLTDGSRPDAVICDIGLPEEDGYQLLVRLRAWEREHAQAALPALALTALDGVRNRLAALQAGFQMHVAKPLDPDELLLVLQSLLARQRQPSSA